MERLELMKAVYRDLASQTQAAQDRILAPMVEVEYSLGDERLRLATECRLLAWLALRSWEAESVARAYDRIMETLPAGPAMRRVAMVQSIVSELPTPEQSRLRRLLGENVCGRDLVTSEPMVSQPRAPWWALWRNRHTASGGRARRPLPT